jgi:tetratricopeptide (TPR) repeat protein
MDVLLRLKETEKDKKELIDLCKIQYKDNTLQLKIVQEFDHSYSSDNALWWYTRDCFLYKILNKALRAQNIHILFLLRSFSRDIYQQLKQNQCPSRVRVYRGQLVSKNELTTLRKSLNQLMSMNSFFSTSTNPAQALVYSSGSDIPNDLERVFFEIDADPNVVTSKPFANISPHSEFKSELEVLFMFGSIFRLNRIHREDNGVWKIQMKLCGDNELDLKEVLVQMKSEYGNKKANLQLLGTVLWKMGKFDLAEKYYQRMISELPSNDRLLIDLYNDLSGMAAMKGDLDASVQWKKKSLEIKTQTTISNAGTNSF